MLGGPLGNGGFHARVEIGGGAFRAQVFGVVIQPANHFAIRLVVEHGSHVSEPRQDNERAASSTPSPVGVASSSGGSSGWSRVASRARARLRRERTVPIGQPRI